MLIVVLSLNLSACHMTLEIEDGNTVKKQAEQEMNLENVKKTEKSKTKANIDEKMANTASEKEEQEESLHKNIDNQKELIAITVNQSDGNMKKVFVDKEKLVDYVNQSKNHEFYFNDFKEKAGLTIDELYDGKELKDLKACSDDTLDSLNSVDFLAFKKQNIELKNVLVEGDYLVGNIDEEPYQVIYDKNRKEVFSKQFMQFYHLGDGYYAGSKYYEDLDFRDFYYHQSSRDHTQDYRLDAIYDGKDWSKFKYFMIDYLGKDIFYLYDGKKFEFINWKTKQPAYEFIDVRFNIGRFVVYDDLIIGTADNGIQILITDKNYMIIKKYYQDKDLEIKSEIFNKDFMLNTYPQFIIKNKKVAKEINNKILEIFDVNYNREELHEFYNENKNAIVKYKTVNFNVLKKQDYVTIQVLSFFEGFGVHPYHSSTFYVFDLKNADLVEQDMLFNNPKKAEDFILNELAEMTLKNYKGLKAERSLSLDTETVYDIFLGENREYFNFALAEDGLHIVYNPYEIGCYAAGKIGYIIPYDKLKPYFKNDVIKKLGI